MMMMMMMMMMMIMMMMMMMMMIMIDDDDDDGFDTDLPLCVVLVEGGEDARDDLRHAAELRQQILVDRVRHPSHSPMGFGETLRGENLFNLHRSLENNPDSNLFLL